MVDIDDDIANIVEEQPLLNIFIPNLDEFSAIKWNTANQIPHVAIRNVNDLKIGNPIIAYDSNGEFLELSYLSNPEIPIIVVKNNERVVKIDNQSEKDSGELLTIPENNNYAFLNNAIPAFATSQDLTVTKKAENDPRKSGHSMDENIRYAYNKKLITHRDYIYYGIDSTENITSGTLNDQYAEHIISIKMENEAAINKVHDFTEGDLEFVITALIPNRDGDPIELKKSIFCKKNDLILYPSHGDIVMLEYQDFDPIELTVWDNYQHGNIWTFTAYEHDDGTETTITNTINSSFTTGVTGTFNFNAGQNVKIGATTNNSVSSNSTSTITTKRTNGHDDLGNGVLRYLTPIYSQIYRGIRLGGDTIYRAAPYTINTGSIRLRVEPVKRY